MSKITNMFRNLLLNELTGNLGKVEVTDNKIICYVDSKRIQRKYDKKNSMYKVEFPNVKRIKIELLDKYDINKPVCYVVEGIRFRDKLVFTGYKDTTVLFRECKFHKQIRINGADIILFEHNNYYDRKDDTIYKNKFLSGRANCIQFIDDNFVSISKGNHAYFNIDLIVDSLDIINCNIDIKESNQIAHIISNNLTIMDSRIFCSSIYWISNNLEMVNSKIISSKCVKIDENNNDGNYSDIINYIESPSIIYNGVEQQITSKDENAKKYHRLALIKELRRIRDNYINENHEQLKKEDNKINQKTIDQIKI